MASNEQQPPVPKTPDELTFFKQQEEHQFQIANKQLELNMQNLRESREYSRELTNKQSRYNLIFLMTAIILFFGFGALALCLNKEAFLTDMSKVVIGALGGSGATLFWYSRRNPHNNQQK